MFSARKAKPAARHPQQSVAPQIESSTTGSSRQIERSTTGSSLDDSNESSRRGDGRLERKELEPPFTPRAGRVPSVPDQGLVKKFGPHRPSDGDSPQQKGGSDEVSLSFKGEQFQGFSVFASPAPPVRRKSSKDLK